MHFALPFCPTSSNVVALDEILDAYDSAFRIAVRKVLDEEGFEVTGLGLPNLQLAAEIREALGWALESQGFEQEWESLKVFLAWAEQQGILVDLNPARKSLPVIA